MQINEILTFFTFLEIRSPKSTLNYVQENSNEKLFSPFPPITIPRYAIAIDQKIDRESYFKKSFSNITINGGQFFWIKFISIMLAF